MEKIVGQNGEPKLKQGDLSSFAFGRGEGRPVFFFFVLLFLAARFEIGSEGTRMR